jgi:hypothetical protein
MPDRVRQLLDRYITSVEQLELLFVLAGDPGTAFTAESASKRVGTTPHSARIRLDELAAAGLARAADGSYIYAATGAEAAAVSELRSLYSTHRVRIISRIFDKPPESVRNFADAFRLKRDT